MKYKIIILLLGIFIVLVCCGFVNRYENLPKKYLKFIQGNVININNYFYFNQGDYKQDYGYGTTIASSGCGVVAVTNVLNNLGVKIEPVQVAIYSLSKGYRVKNQGTSDGLFFDIGSKYNFNVRYLNSKLDLIDELKNGSYVILSMKPGYFTSGGHYIVASSFSNNQTYILDSAKLLRNGYYYIDFLLSQCKRMVVISK